MKVPRRLLTAAILTPPLAFAGGPVRAASDEAVFGVYEYALDQKAGTFDETTRALESAFAARGLDVLAKIDSGTPEGCAYRARVLAVVSPAHARTLMAVNPKTAPFGVVDRINVFEDERGVHVALVNPESITRTILMDDPAAEQLSRDQTQALRAAIAEARLGPAVHREYGEARKRGHIGKTMGVMAGGPFNDKVNDEFVIASSDWRAVSARVRNGLARAGAKWGLRLAYEFELPDHETAIFGSTGPEMDRKSFSIVGAGADKTRDSFQCPGLAHAAAYPIEVVVARDANKVKVRIVDAMYRMKMYFEDAGKWAFMKNMGMPGSIHDELVAQIKSGLGPQ